MDIQPILDAFPLPSNRGILNEINKDATDKAIAQIIAEPAEAAKLLAGKLLDPDNEASDVQARHAIHATAIRIPNIDRNAQVNFSKGLANSLADERPDRVKGFIIRQLQVCGGKEVIPAIGKFLTVEGLADDAGQALLAIGGSAEQFRKALPKTNDNNTLRQINLHGLAELGDKSSKDTFLKALGDKDGECRLLALWGLVQVGDSKTVDTFLKAEQKEKGYARNKAAHLCLQFAEKLAKKDAAKVYKHLQATRKDPSEKHLQDIAKAAL
jgi:HEAT repeat protein